MIKNKLIGRSNFRRGLVGCLVFFLLMSTTTSFAAERVDSKQVKLCSLEYQINKIVETEDMVNRLSETRNGYIPSMENVNISIPKYGRDNIKLVAGEEQIEMKLPEEVLASKGLVSEDGYVMYQTEEEVDVVVQAIEEKISKNEQRSGVRTMISISDENAPKEYEFTYDLPEGYCLIMGKELNNAEINDDAIGIVNSEGYAVAIIDSPWALDAKGNTIPTKYRIEGNTVVQEIEFDKDTKFPVVADPSTIVDTKTETSKHKITTKWLYCDQLSGGYSFQSGGSVGWWTGAGSSKSITFESAFTTKNLTTMFTVGKIEEKVSGNCILINFPASKERKKVQVRYDLLITEKATSNKYRNTSITDNGKTQTTTYHWVVVKNWIDKVEKKALDSRLVKA